MSLTLERSRPGDQLQGLDVKDYVGLGGWSSTSVQSNAIDEWMLGQEISLETKDRDSQRLRAKSASLQDHIGHEQGQIDRLKEALEKSQFQVESVSTDTQAREEERLVLEKAAKFMHKSLNITKMAFKPVDMLQYAIEAGWAQLEARIEYIRTRNQRAEAQLSQQIECRLEELESRSTEEAQLQKDLLDATQLLAEAIQREESDQGLRSELQIENEEIRRKTRRVEDAVEQFSTRVDVVKDEIKELRSQSQIRKAELEAEIQRQRQRLARQEQQRAELEQTGDGQTQVGFEREAILLEGRAELDKLDTTLARLEAERPNRRCQVEAEQHTLAQELAELDRKDQEARARVESLEKQIGLGQPELKTLQVKIKAQEEAIREGRAENEQLSQVGDDLIRARVALEAAHKEIRSLRSAQAKFIGQQKANSTLRNQLGQIQRDIRAADESLGTLRHRGEMVDEQETEHSRLEEELRGKKRALVEAKAREKTRTDLERVLEVKSTEYKTRQHEIQASSKASIQGQKATTERLIANKARLERDLIQSATELKELARRKLAIGSMEPWPASDHSNPGPSALLKTNTTDSSSSGDGLNLLFKKLPVDRRQRGSSVSSLFN